MSSMQNNVGIRQILICIANGVMVDINPSSHRPRAEILKIASYKLIMQSIIDCFGHTDDWL